MKGIECGKLNNWYFISFVLVKKINNSNFRQINLTNLYFIIGTLNYLVTVKKSI